MGHSKFSSQVSNDPAGRQRSVNPEDVDSHPGGRGYSTSEGREWGGKGGLTLVKVSWVDT